MSDLKASGGGGGATGFVGLGFGVVSPKGEGVGSHAQMIQKARKDPKGKKAKDKWKESKQNETDEYLIPFRQKANRKNILKPCE